MYSWATHARQQPHRAHNVLGWSGGQAPAEHAQQSNKRWAHSDCIRVIPIGLKGQALLEPSESLS